MSINTVWCKARPVGSNDVPSSGENSQLFRMPQAVELRCVGHVARTNQSAADGCFSNDRRLRSATALALWKKEDAARLAFSTRF